MFLLSLIVLVINQFLKRQFILDYQIPIISFSIALGVLTFYSNRDKVETELEEEKKKEESEEKRRGAEFGKKFPRLNRIWGVRGVVRWMYAEGWWYSWGLVAIVVLGFVLRIRNLGISSFWGDEIVIIYSALNLLDGNGFTVLSGEPYIQAILATLFVSFSFLFLEASEFSARLPFVIIGTFTILINYIVVKKIFNSKNVALLTTIGISISLWLINYSREVRFYAFNVFVLYIIIMCLYSFILTKKTKYLLILTFAMVIGTINHLIILILTPILIFPILFYLKEKIRRFNKIEKLHLIIVFLVSILLIILFRGTITYFLFDVNDYDFWSHSYLFYYNLFIIKFKIITIIFLSVAVSSIFYRKKVQDYLFIYSSIIIATIMSIIIDAKTERYALIIYPLILVISIKELYCLVKTQVSLKYLVFTITFLFLVIGLTPFYDGFMVSQSKIAYDSVLQKNKYAWREGVYYLKNNVVLNEEEIMSSNGLLTDFYGVKANYTHRGTKTMKNNVNRSYFSGLKILEDVDSFKGYIILDYGDKIKSIYPEILLRKDIVKIYEKEGIIILYKEK